MNIEQQNRIELGDLVRYIAESRKIDYREAENLLPPYIFEDGHICDDEEGDWAKEVVQYLLLNDIDSVQVYQDC